MAIKKQLFCTPDDVKVLLSATASDYSHNDPAILECLAIATSIITKHVGRNLKLGTHSEYVNLPRMSGARFNIYTQNAPVIDGSMVAKYSPSGDWANVDPLTDDLFGTVDIERGSFYFGGNVDRSSPNGIKLTYQAGFPVVTDEQELSNRGLDTEQQEAYELLDVPLDIQQATAIQASFLLNRFKSNDTGKRGDEGSVVAKQSVYGVTPDAAKLLVDYRRPRYRGV